MRSSYTILFLCGMIFAAIAWVGLLSPIGVLVPQYRYTMREIGLSLMMSSLAFWGYLVWLCWGWFAIQGRWSSVAAGRVSLVSLAVHSGWLILLPLMRRESWLEFASSGWPIMAWLTINLMIAFAVLLNSVCGEAQEASLAFHDGSRVDQSSAEKMSKLRSF